MLSKRSDKYMQDDGLITPEVGSWAEDKYNIVSIYTELFANSMKSKWDAIVYIDLFAGAGFSRIRDTEKLIAASPLLALHKDFNKYIFCDKREDNCDALSIRSDRLKPGADIVIIHGDANDCSDQILSLMPKPSKSYKVLALCFVDPFKMGNLKFSTIKNLSQRFVDFLVLIPSGMDANRNLDNYIKKKNTTVDEFIGNFHWRDNWNDREYPLKTYEEFIVEEFSKSMANLGYKSPELHDCCPIRSSEKNLLLYRLSLFSRNSLGKKFWKETKKYCNPQKQLFD